MDAQAPDVGEKIRTEKVLSKETEAKLRRVIETFTDGFKQRRVGAGFSPPAASTQPQGQQPAKKSPPKQPAAA